MNTEKERAEFEAVFKKPFGVRWSDDVNVYILEFDFPQCGSARDIYQATLDGWQARAAQAEKEFGESIDAINERSRLRVENEGLRAQVERLRELGARLVSEEDDETAAVALDQFSRALSETPRQSLAHVRAEAVEGAAKSLCEFRGHLYHSTGYDELMEYAQQLREQSDD